MRWMVSNPRLTKDNLVNRLCAVCTRDVTFEGKNAKAKHKAALARYGSDLCTLCAKARDVGRYEYACKACDVRVIGSEDELRNCLHINGHPFCPTCMRDFYGPYRADNEALRILLRAIDEDLETRSGVAGKNSDRQEALYREEVAYQKEVRRLSHRNLKAHSELLNPHGHPIGPSKIKGSYQLDHIVPVTICFQNYVPEEAAASVPNLQVIPWFVNVSRNNHFDERKLIGWPGPPAPPLRITRDYIIQD